MSIVSKVILIVFGVSMIGGGLYCLFTPELTYLTVGFIVGLSMVFDAVGGFLIWWQQRKIEGQGNGWLLTSAILSAVFGFFILNNAALQLSLDVFIVYYIAIWLLIHGIIVAIRSFKIRQLRNDPDTANLGKRWYIPLIFGILLCVFGVLSLLNPSIIASTIGIFIGLGIISAGANMISLAFTPME